ncbi:hypothetical protein EVAR_6970_1 [Eumeta japonica]|uniref:Uncharacterized protein n=1 Tax=Eumeta variegata TaxID=151549 RepID=A0A4C1TGM3_EUMVA|nr:hypothetical protein EVAR_6970_1 [Eumeta japonica]
MNAQVRVKSSANKQVRVVWWMYKQEDEVRYFTNNCWRWHGEDSQHKTNTKFNYILLRAQAQCGGGDRVVGAFCEQSVARRASSSTHALKLWATCTTTGAARLGGPRPGGGRRRPSIGGAPRTLPNTRTCTRPQPTTDVCGESNEKKDCGEHFHHKHELIFGGQHTLMREDRT